MADSEQLSSSLQESVLTLIAFNDEKGNVVAGLLSADLFEEPYRDIAQRILDFRKKFNKAPGREHIDDVFDHVLVDPDHRQFQSYQRILRGLLEQAKGLNAEYVVTRVTEFIRRQTLKAGVLKAAQRYQTGGDNVADDVERILLDTVKVRVDAMSPGLFLNNDHESLSFLEDPPECFVGGIPELDKRDIGPTRKELMILMAPKGGGKTWGLINYGKRAIVNGKRVAHVTLEMSEKRTSQRYHQSIFAIAKRDEEFNQTMFELDSLGRLQALSQEKMRPEMALNNPDVYRYLLKRRSELGTRLGNLVIKEFPSGSLTIAALKAWLDGLEVVHGWVPDLLIIDYADLMKIDAKDMRHGLSRNIVDLRGLASERNMAILTAKQTNRMGAGAKYVTDQHASEDFSAFMTADIAVTYSQTLDEKILGLARLFVAKARNDEDKFTVLITQNYKTGQFCLGSTSMISDYFDRLKAFAGELKDTGDSEEDDDE